MTVSADTKELHRLARKLERVREKGLPHAARNTLNRYAFEARGLWQEEMRKHFTLRNRYTERSVRVGKARGMQVRTLEARVGSVADYLEDQEHGGTRTAKQGKHKPIPNRPAAGESPGGGKLTRLVRRPYKIGSITVDARASASSRKQRNAIAIRRAMKAKRRLLLLESEQGLGIYRLKGRKKNLHVLKLWDLSRPSVPVKPNPTLGRALDKLAPMQARIAVKELEKQIAWGKR